MANEDLCAGNVPPIYPPKGKCQCQEEISELRDEMLGRLTDKQDKLTAGEGITIEKVGSDTVISSSSSIRIFRPVNVLPDASEADENSIYLTPKEDGGVDEWNVIEEGGQKVWNKFGEASIDLSGYVKDEDVTKEYLLERLDYEEIPVSMTTSEETKDYIFLGKEESGCTERVLATGGAMSGSAEEYEIVTMGTLTWQDRTYEGDIKAILTNCVVNGVNIGEVQASGIMASSVSGWQINVPGILPYLSNNGKAFEIVELVNEGDVPGSISFDSITIKNKCDEGGWKPIAIGGAMSASGSGFAEHNVGTLELVDIIANARNKPTRVTIENLICNGESIGTYVGECDGGYQPGVTQFNPQIRVGAGEIYIRDDTRLVAYYNGSPGSISFDSIVIEYKEG